MNANHIYEIHCLQRNPLNGCAGCRITRRRSQLVTSNGTHRDTRAISQLNFLIAMGLHHIELIKRTPLSVDIYRIYGVYSVQSQYNFSSFFRILS